MCVHCVGVVVGGREDGCYQVQDATGAVQMVPRHDIITDQDDANRLLCVSVKDVQIMSTNIINIYKDMHHSHTTIYPLYDYS